MSDITKWSVRNIKGVGDKRAELLEKIGLKTVGDVLYDFPRRYRDRTKLTEVFFRLPEGEVLFKAKVIKKYLSRTALFLDVLSELTRIQVVFFNARYLYRNFVVNETYYFFGSVRDGSIYNPEFSAHLDDHFLRIVPVYGLTKGLNQSTADRIHAEAVAMMKKAGIPENLPDFMLDAYMTRYEAVLALHEPADFERIAPARRRIVAEELFCLFRQILQQQTRAPAVPMRNLDMSVTERIPYKLTEDQLSAIRDVKRDLESGYTMNRLINGDVGCGKSVVAFVSAKMVADLGFQVLIMAPTAILAEQLFRGYAELFGGEGVGFLSSKLPAKEKREILEGAADGRLRVLIGTHAVLSDRLVFRNLSLVITDEQQRFGAAQRERALGKAKVGHNLYFTATPIPGTLARTFFANMDVTRIEQMPSGRTQVVTRRIDPPLYRKMFAFIQSRIDRGEQVYVVVPSIDGERGGIASAEKALQRGLKARIGCIHGEMKSERIRDTVRSFREGALDVLVSTTIVEVGIDNPNASVMVIVESERFGLSQLHQLRGRVGRGKLKSHCFLLTGSGGGSEGGSERIDVLLRSTSGFEIAEADLAMRGPGMFFDGSQSGEIALHFPCTEEEMMAVFAYARRFVSSTSRDAE